MPDELPPGPPEQPGQPAPRPPRRRSAKDELMRLQRERVKKEQEEKRRKAVFAYAKSDLEKVVAEDAADKDYDDPWHYVEQVVEHGCSSGMVPGLVYYNETSKFYEKHKEEIWEMLYEDSEAMGEGNILTMLSQMRWAENVTNEDTFENYLAWYAYETACQHLLDRKELGPPEGEDEEDDGPINIGLG